ncbi:MAG: alpha-galactosidase [Clostridia bacterium]|nr:alpha-galactosidase [Clostridia bacterium]
MKNHFPASLRINGIYSEVSQLKNPSIQVILTETNGEYLYRRMTLTNIGNTNSKKITDPLTLDVRIPCKETLLLHTLRGDDNSKESFFPVDKRVSVGENIVLTPSGGRSSSTTAFPFIDFTIDGKVVLLAIGWSGKWKCTVNRDETTVHITVGLAHAAFFLYPEESVELPSIFLLEGVEGEPASSVRRRFRRILLKDMNPLPNRKKLPIAIQPFDRYYHSELSDFWRTEEGQLKTLEGANKIGGMDTYWLDAAWFANGFPSGVGNYTFHEGFPNGLKFLSEAVSQSKKELVVWFEPERVHEESDVFNLHPEFLLACSADEKNYLYNLGNDEAYAWLYRLLSAYIRGNGIHHFRQDFNMSPLPYWTENDEKDREGICEIKHIMGLYRLWDDLKTEFPDLYIDNCSSGGRRIDLETVRRAVPLWRSDIACRPITKTNPSDIWNQNQILALTEYLPYHSSCAWEPKANDIRSSATEGIACAFDVLNSDFDFSAADIATKEVKSLQQYWDGDFYALTTPTLDENVFVAYQLSKKESGYAAIFRRRACEENCYSLRLQDIDVFANYSVIVSDEHYIRKTQNVRGAILFKGFDVFLPDPQTSAIVIYQKINSDA